VRAAVGWGGGGEEPRTQDTCANAVCAPQPSPAASRAIVYARCQRSLREERNICKAESRRQMEAVADKTAAVAMRGVARRALAAPGGGDTA